VNFEFKKTFAVQKKITVNGQEYESLDQVPTEYRAAIEKALGSDVKAATTITVNGHTYQNQELPAPLRAVVSNLALAALKSAGEAKGEQPPVDSLRPEPMLSMKKVVIAIAVGALLVWLARVVF
jgi:hypothetical protein